LVTGLRIDRFRGTVPKVSPRLLAEGYGQVARNCRLGSGDLEPLRTLQEITSTTADTKTIYRYGEHWLSWECEVDVVPGPIAADTTRRTIYTGDGYPRQIDQSTALAAGTGSYPRVSYRLGIPMPATKPGVEASGEGDTELLEERHYVYTYVSGWGEEGVPSAPSDLVTVQFGQDVVLSGVAAAPTGNHNITAKRVYRTSTGGSGDFMFVAEIPVAQADYTDSLDEAQLGEVLPSDEWSMPPDESYPTGALSGVVSLPNGVLAGFTGNEICLSEPYLPYAWPQRYRLVTDFPIVALGVSSGGLVVATTGYPYLVTGTDPASMVMSKLEVQQSCISKRSMVELGRYVIYASPDGLVAVSGSTVELISDSVIDREAWQELNPSSMHGYLSDGRYVGFYKDSVTGVTASFLFDPTERSLVFMDQGADGGFSDLESDTLYLQSGGKIHALDRGTTNQSLSWRSAQYSISLPVNFGSATVKSKGYPIIFKLYLGNSEAPNVTRTVRSSRPFRLPGGIKADSLSIELEGDQTIESVALGTSIEALKNGG